MDTTAGNIRVNVDDLYLAINSFKKLNTEKIISEIINNLEKNDSIKYIGELNKNDLMY